jgi:hypothetical protein
VNEKDGYAEARYWESLSPIIWNAFMSMRYMAFDLRCLVTADRSSDVKSSESLMV